LLALIYCPEAGNGKDKERRFLLFLSLTNAPFLGKKRKKILLLTQITAEGG